MFPEGGLKRRAQQRTGKQKVAEADALSAPKHLGRLER